VKKRRKRRKIELNLKKQSVRQGTLNQYRRSRLGLLYRSAGRTVVSGLDVGKDANLLILSGDPLDVGTKIDKVMIEGKIVHEAS